MFYKNPIIWCPCEIQLNLASLLFDCSLLLVFTFFSQGTKVIDESHDQDTTDLDKCILFIRDSPLNQESSKVS